MVLEPLKKIPAICFFKNCCIFTVQTQQTKASNLH